MELAVPKESVVVGEVKEVELRSRRAQFIRELKNHDEVHDYDVC